MRILTRYFSRQLIATFIMLLLVLSGLAYMLQILTMLKFLLKYGISVGGFLGLTMLMVPMIISIIMPFVAFIAATFVYNKMIGDNEITVMAASGMSARQLAAPAIRLSVILTALHFALSLWIVPATQAKFYDTQWKMRYGLAHMKLQEASFNQLSDGLIVYVDKVAGNDLSQLMIYDSRDHKNELTIMSEKGKLVATNRGLSVVMSNGSLQAKSSNLTTGTFASFDMDMSVADKNGEHGFKIRSITTAQLLEMTRQDLSTKRRGQVFSECATRFLSPLMNMVLILICMVFLLKAPLLRRRFSMSAPYAVLGMAAAMAAFMSASGLAASAGFVSSMAIGIISLIVILFVILGRK